MYYSDTLVKLFETYKELENSQNDIKNANTIGIMAGASTPQKSIEEVVEYLNKE